MKTNPFLKSPPAGVINEKQNTDIILLKNPVPIEANKKNARHHSCLNDAKSQSPPC